MTMLLGNGFAEYLTALGWSIFALFDLFTSRFEYWTRLKIPGPDPNAFCGNIAAVIFKKISFVERINEFYEKWKSFPYFGIFIWRTPVLIVNDLDVINNILVENSKLFSSENIDGIKNVNPVNLFKISKNFKIDEKLTVENVKKMFVLMLKSIESYDFDINRIDNYKIINSREFTENLISDVMGSCLFGIDTSQYSEKKDKFRKILGEIFDSEDLNLWDKFLRAFKRHRMLEQQKFFVKLIDERMKSGDEDNTSRPDLIDILRASRTSGSDEWDFAAQAFYLLASGYKASSSLISSALWELAINQDIQEKLRIEILETLQIHEDKLSYDVVNEMEYISMVLDETLRKNPAVPLLARKLNEKCRIEEDSPFFINKNTRIIIPVASIHYNDEYYPDPHTFKPERFSKEEIEKRHSMAYLPYGKGLHHCIGEKFSLSLAKITLINVLKRFRIESLNEKMKNSKNSEGIHLKFLLLKN